MEGIFNILEGFEKLAYRILIWVILIPKTLIQIIVNPGWAPGYIKGELKQEKNPFDEYNSPVVLMLVVALIPALLINFLPETGVTLTRPETKTSAHEGTIESWLSKNDTSNQETYEAEADFTSSSTKMQYEYTWYVEEVLYDNEGNFDRYKEIQDTREVHSEADGSGSYITHVDNNTAQDQYFYSFPHTGEFYINVTAAIVDPKTNTPLESYYDYIYVFVPEEADLKGYIEDSRIKNRQGGGGNKPPLETLSGLLKKETTIFLAIGMMLPPLLYAFATRLVTRKEISENSLKEVFYAQCYYFSPLQLAIWAFVYSISFFTDDLFSYKEWAFFLILVPPLLALGWFISVQVNALIEEGKEKKEPMPENENQGEGLVTDNEEEKSRITRFGAFLVVMFCLAIVGAAVVFIINFASDPQMQDNMRKFAIWFYLMGTAGLIVAYLIRWERKRRIAKRRFTFGNVFLIGPLSLISIIIIWAGVVPGKAPAAVPTSEAVLESAAPTEAPVDTPTPEPTQIPQATATLPTEIPETATPASQPYYTEQFDGDLGTWQPFVIGGDDSMVEINQADSKLAFQVNPRDNKTPSFYAINEAFSYQDVAVELVTDNNGNNANGVSLVCRHSNRGWYEFIVSNSGSYAIFAYSSDPAHEGYTLLFSGGSSAIKSGKTTNTFTAICQGSDLSLVINGTLARTVSDTKFGFTEGSVGIGVSSPEGLPVNVDIDSFTVAKP